MGILERVHTFTPEAVVAADAVVGFPGGAEEDFQQTLEVVGQARFSSTFAFLYSPHPGAPAADREDQIPTEVTLDRYKRLIALQEGICTEGNIKLVGSSVEALICENKGRKGGATHRIMGRTRDNRPVRIILPENVSRQDLPRPGDMVTARVTYGTPHHLIVDSVLEGGLWQLRRIRVGDMRGQRQAQEGDQRISLEIPRIRMSH